MERAGVLGHESWWNEVWEMIELRGKKGGGTSLMKFGERENVAKIPTLSIVGMSHSHK